MADAEPVSSSADAQQQAAPADPPATDREASLPETNVEVASKEATIEVNAPEGNGTAEAAVDTSSAANDAPDSAVAKEKKRKSSSGVPEHKTKKLNKKKSTTTLRLDCKPGDLYWARLKGYPAWPSVICDEEMLPETLLASRPVSAARPDGSLREDFREGGKSAKDRTYPIMFLYTNEFAWLINTALAPLDPEECKTPTGKLGKQLAEAYKIAAEKPDLDYFKGLLQQFQEESVALEAAQRQREAEAEEKAAAKAKRDAEKKARKSKGGDDEDVEMENGEGTKPSKKRKTDADSDADGQKSKKPLKITKLNAPKTPNGDTAKKPAKPKKKVTAPKADDAGEQEAPMTESERLAHREKHVLYLRHKLQKAFLSRETAPKEDEMPDMDGHFKQLERYEDLEPDLIRATKIHKVLKGIVKLDAVPLDDKFAFKKRSQTMLETWNHRMESDAGSVAKPVTTNGDAEETKVKPAAEKTADELDQKVEQTNETAEEAEPKADAAAHATSEGAKELEKENAGDNAAAPDADGDVKMEDRAAGKPEHD